MPEYRPPTSHRAMDGDEPRGDAAGPPSHAVDRPLLTDDELAAPLLRLSRQEYVRLLSQLDHDAGAPVKPYSPINRRMQQRIPFHQEARLTLEVEGAPGLEISTRCRNISKRGLAFLHTELIESGTRCEVVLSPTGEPPVTASGVVVRSRRLRGTVHEIGLRFDSTVRLADVLPADGVAGSIARRRAAI